MNSQIIVIVQVLIAGTFILWIFSRKGSTPKPTILNLSEGNTKSPQSKYDIKRHRRPQVIDQIPSEPKMLNVVFMWNGYAWDAYEVLGLPAGSPMEAVVEKYSELLSKSDEGQRQFLEAAKMAIQNKINSG